MEKQRLGIKNKDAFLDSLVNWSRQQVYVVVNKN